jgi:ubiquitin C-terminal hydrolase
LNNNLVYPEKLTLPVSKEKYELYGTVVHFGSGVGGHYYSYVKVEHLWYKCDDEKVSLAAIG